MIWTNSSLSGLFLLLYMLPALVWMCAAVPSGTAVPLFSSLLKGYGERFFAALTLTWAIFLLTGSAFGV